MSVLDYLKENNGFNEGEVKDPKLFTQIAGLKKAVEAKLISKETCDTLIQLLTDLHINNRIKR